MSHGRLSRRSEPDGRDWFERARNLPRREILRERCSGQLGYFRLSSVPLPRSALSAVGITTRRRTALTGGPASKEPQLQPDPPRGSSIRLQPDPSRDRSMTAPTCTTWVSRSSPSRSRPRKGWTAGRWLSLSVKRTDHASNPRTQGSVLRAGSLDGRARWQVSLVETSSPSNARRATVG
jgi:hypothetical protein